MKLKNNPNYLLIGAVAAILVQTACNNKEKQKGIKAIDISNMDTTVRPQDDFYTYANGSWLATNKIPASESRWGSFSILQEETNARLKSLLEETAKKTNAKEGSNDQKVGDFYASGMDSIAIEKEGISALKPELEMIDAAKSKEDILKLVARFQTYGINPLFDLYVDQDAKISSQYIINCTQGGLSLPDRDYYLKTDPRSVTIQKEYLAHLKNMFKLMGNDESIAAKNATTVNLIETQLAKSSRTRVALRDQYLNYNKFKVSDLANKTSSINWKNHFTELGVKNINEFIIGQPEFFAEVDKMLNSVSVDDWKTYLKWHLISSNASNLNNSFVMESFNFRGKVLNGTTEIKPRWKRVLNEADGALGEAIGEVYVKKYFSDEAKKRCKEMVNNMQSVLGERIQKLTWMSDSTKQQAKAKLDAFIVKIGFPDKFIDYSSFKVDRKSYVVNSMNGNKFSFNRMIDQLGKPIDKTKWGMTPQTINAYYNPSINEIVFPAGILQFPFFDPNVDDAINYGGIGAVICHEFTHGFDDQGSQFDKDGNLKNWWSENDNKLFKEKTKVLIDQYNNYRVLDTVKVNGELTQGENAADLGGITIAYEAFKRTPEGKENKKIDGFTAEQRFFLSWAQIWRGNIRDENLMIRINTDPHSPGIFRANGPLTNFDPFYAAFNVKEGDKMFKPEAERARIW